MIMSTTSKAVEVISHLCSNILKSNNPTISAWHQLSNLFKLDMVVVVGRGIKMCCLGKVSDWKMDRQTSSKTYRWQIPCMCHSFRKGCNNESECSLQILTVSNKTAMLLSSKTSFSISIWLNAAILPSAQIVKRWKIWYYQLQQQILQCIWLFT